MRRSLKQWMELLPEPVFHILWEKGTEPAFTGKYVDETRNGVYHCAGCGQKLFDSSSKFHSGSGWPSFKKPIKKDVLEEKMDFRFGLQRVEVLCSCCGGHLGHVFDDGPPPEGNRFCINSLALNFKERKK
ncbi:MAG: peptide-methionine (R)-S-oxide reductase MsrB [Candidatus Thermoplasmatota archaeon]|nr:peptide-methionine (R)-S-oxide reductase MsrB [Candidatus Thermoplasmatota archaeon]